MISTASHVSNRSSEHTCVTWIIFRYSHYSWYPQPLIVPIEVLDIDMDQFLVLTLPCNVYIVYIHFSPWLPTYFEFSEFKTITKIIDKLHFLKKHNVFVLCVCFCLFWTNQKGTVYNKTFNKQSPEQWTKPWLFRWNIGDEIQPSYIYIGIIS